MLSIRFESVLYVIQYMNGHGGIFFIFNFFNNLKQSFFMCVCVCLSVFNRIVFLSLSLIQSLYESLIKSFFSISVFIHIISAWFIEYKSANMKRITRRIYIYRQWFSLNSFNIQKKVLPSIRILKPRILLSTLIGSMKKLQSMSIS